MAANDPGPVTERPAPTRRVRPVAPERTRRPAPPTPPSSGGSHFWQALAIIALIVATAGWTATGMLLLRGDNTGTGDIPTGSADVGAGPEDSSSPAPIPISHDVPDLEVRLPTAVNGTTLGPMSWTGDHFFERALYSIGEGCGAAGGPCLCGCIRARASSKPAVRGECHQCAVREHGLFNSPE